MDTRTLHFIIIDSWHPQAVMKELEAGNLPALQFLVRHGRMSLDCASIFPTVTPACLTSLATGVGPDQHGITGVLWYNRGTDRYVHYWPYPQSLYWGTIDHVITDFFLRMNREHLSPRIKTIFELLEEADVPSASVNFPISRGPYQHTAQLPWFIRRLGKLPRDLMIPGPRYMRHGDMIRGKQPRNRFFGKYGFNDHQSALHTAELVREDRPAFLLTYLNENDLRTHHKGPENIGWSLRRVDRELGLMLDAYGSWEQAVKHARWIITGDHSQSNTYPYRPGYAVNVFKAFPKHRVAPLRGGGLEEHGFDFAVTPNDRMSMFYFPQNRAEVRDDVLEIVSQWPSVDQVFWREGEWFHGLKRETGATMRWRRGGPHVDPHGETWELHGDLSVAGAALVGNRVIYPGDYPNTVSRVASALSVPGGGSLLVTATLGREYTSGFPMGRGNHGSLHAQDTHVPLVMVGVDTPVVNPRTIDIVPAILREFGVALPDYMRPTMPVPREAS
ncbi:MAG: Type phosphodiesterase / nucleotide pyrophosphatase [Cyanobacteria bacterium RYN_339]|nr:Type phosphodiesterase / nucleotide pyrophosphatase [Cyanobacteria bacterium RYN_339]